MPYLVKQWNTYSARWRVPEKCQPLFDGKKVLKKSLGTHDKQVAQRLAYQQVEQWKRMCDTESVWQYQLDQLPEDGTPVAVGIDNGQEVLRPFNRAEYVVDQLTSVLPDNEVDSIMASDDYRAHVTREIIPFEQYLEPWVRRLTATPKTIEQKRHDVQWFINSFPYVHLVNRKALRSWFEEQDKATATLKRALGSIRQFWQYVELEEDGDLGDPFRNISVAGQRKAVEKEAFARDELQMVYDSLTRDDEKLLVQVLALSGMRIEEACSATYEANKIIIAKGKTKAAERTIPLHSALDASEIREWQKTLVTGAYDRLSQNVGRSINRKIRGLGFGPEKTVHCIRRYVATQLESNGVEELSASRILGHNLKTMSYGLYSSGQDVETLRSAVERLEQL